jgi:cellobiose phosphorylase
MVVESLPGLRKQGAHLYFRSLLPKTWTQYKLHHRYRQTVHHLAFIRDPDAPPPEPLHLQTDRQEHPVEIKVVVPRLRG